MSLEETKITVIDLSPIFDFCCVCDEEVLMEYGLAMYEDAILPADWPGEWGGFTACRNCYNLFTGIREPLSVHEARKLLPVSEAMVYPYVG
jgi:hypothetical protein